jgi:hypothetical protein
MRSLLSYALVHNFKNMETIKYIMTIFPEQVTMGNNDGIFPIHWALAKYDNYKFDAFELVKLIYNIYPEGLWKKTINHHRRPIHWLEIGTKRSHLENLRLIEFLTKDFPQSIDIPDPIDGVTIFDKWRVVSVDMHRLLTRIGRVNHQQEFRDLNFQARRMAMFLAFVGVSDDVEMNIWRKLKLKNTGELLRYTIAFL